MNLESMSNKDLRQKCVEYGLPNVPITASSRKVMQKRLVAAMSGEVLAASTPPTKTKRRDTVHDFNQLVSTETTPNKNSGGDIKTPTIDTRSVRRSKVILERMIPTASVTNNLKEANILPERIILHHSPEQSIPIQKETVKKTLYPQLPIKEPSPQAVHLGKSEVFTTSYMKEPKQNTHTPLNSTYASAEETIDMYSKLSPEKVSEQSNFKSYKDNMIKNPLFSKTSDALDYGKETSIPARNYLSHNLNVGRQSTATRYSTASPLTRSLFSNTQQQQQQQKFSTSYIDTYVKNDDDYSWEEGEILEDNADDDTNKSFLDEDIETPYLSEYTRKLSKLKATPLNKTLDLSTNTNYPSSTSTSLYQRDLNRRYTTNIAARRTFQKLPKENDITFLQFLNALNRKYHLKQTSIVVLIFVVGIFVYYVTQSFF